MNQWQDIFLSANKLPRRDTFCIFFRVFFDPLRDRGLG